MLCFFFFKQKTAYEMRISDWSSDVCSSDLRDHRTRDAVGDEHRPFADQRRVHRGDRIMDAAFQRFDRGAVSVLHLGDKAIFALADFQAAPQADRRSEEHTSELQSLMRISYAVFCLKQTNND